MKTTLLRFKVTNFRSIEESDWITLGDNTCLVGTNEAGKSNLLIALWKLRPANEESIRPLSDFPRHLYSKFKAEEHEKDIFIEAEFALGTAIQQQIATSLNYDPELVSVALVQRNYEGNYFISLPYSKIEKYSKNHITSLFQNFIHSLAQNEAYIKESKDNKHVISSLLEEIKPQSVDGYYSKEDINNILIRLRGFISNEFGKKQNLPELFQQGLIMPLMNILNLFDGKPIQVPEEIHSLILNNIPNFVYYSDYGNLDSEIYLPRVIEDLRRKDLSESSRAKARTLEVLFKYVNLSPEEIYELGNDRKVIVKTLNQYNGLVSVVEEDLSSEEVNEWAEKKKKRGVLLKSASSELTKSFKQWWQQGNYIFSFEADGNHFRINVADELRPEFIELEGRSRGLQWFFSFFLVFLVETKEEHTNSILLLDEPGLSLHPTAQYDLSKFFHKLTENNQLIYTSHSPFLVDMDNLANIKAVYVDSETGRTKISSNLRSNIADAEKSIYPVHAALGLTVSDTLLLGCLPVLVEGPSDQIYLNMIKRYLISKGLIRDNRELVFIPTGGVKGMGPIIKLVASRDNELPFVLLDSDRSGREYIKQLHSGLYSDQKDLVLEISHFLGEGAFEIEDILPVNAIVDIINRNYRSKNYFDEVYKTGEPIVNQIERWAKDEGIKLDNGWKVELAREVINRFDRVMKDVPAELEQLWEQLFKTFLKK